jgi:hypothetical protein
MQSCNQCHKIITIVNYDRSKNEQFSSKNDLEFYHTQFEACFFNRSSSLASPLEVTKIVRTTATNGVTLWCVAQV